MFTLDRAVTPENAGALFGIGMFSGLALAPAAIVEGFAVFAFVFALVMAGSIPG